MGFLRRLFTGQRDDDNDNGPVQDPSLRIIDVGRFARRRRDGGHDWYDGDPRQGGRYTGTFYGDGRASHERGPEGE